MEEPQTTFVASMAYKYARLCISTFDEKKRDLFYQLLQLLVSDDEKDLQLQQLLSTMNPFYKKLLSFFEDPSGKNRVCVSM